MNAKNDLEFLSARRYMYRMFQRLLGDMPTSELIAAIDVEVALVAFESLGDRDADEKGAYFCELLGDAAESVEELASEYTRLFVGPAALPAPPWESVYRDRQRTIMTKTTLDVRNAYRAQGFVPQLYPSVPDDHIALELDFLASLADDSVDAFLKGDADAGEALLRASSRFVEQHLGMWIKPFSKDLSEQGGSAFYAAAAEALCSFVAVDREKLGSLCR